jgi:hypothetical protein
LQGDGIAEGMLDLGDGSFDLVLKVSWDLALADFGDDVIQGLEQFSDLGDEEAVVSNCTNETL